MPCCSYSVVTLYGARTIISHVKRCVLYFNEVCAQSPIRLFFYCFLLFCFPSMLLMCFLQYFEIVLVVIIAGNTLVFILQMRPIYTVMSLNFRTSSACLLIKLLYSKILKFKTISIFIIRECDVYR
jgi:hypothetical protein